MSKRSQKIANNLRAGFGNPAVRVDRAGSRPSPDCPLPDALRSRHRPQNPSVSTPGNGPRPLKGASSLSIMTAEVPRVQVHVRDIKNLYPSPRNARTHSKKRFAS